MAIGKGSKVPFDENVSPELRKFHDAEARRTDEIDTNLTTLTETVDAIAFASQAEAEAGVNTVHYMNPLRTAQAIAALAPNLYLYVRDEKAANTEGGTFTSGADRTRTLNTVVTNTIPGASLGSNQITLPIGKYQVRATAPAWVVFAHRAWLYDTTGAATLILGTSESSQTSVISRSFVFGQFTLSVQSVLELRHKCNTTRATEGFGKAVNFNSENEVYATVEIWKVP